MYMATGPTYSITNFGEGVTREDILSPGLHKYFYTTFLSFLCILSTNLQWSKIRSFQVRKAGPEVTSAVWDHSPQYFLGYV